jgi:Holliday junction resolvase
MTFLAVEVQEPRGKSVKVSDEGLKDLLRFVMYAASWQLG